MKTICYGTALCAFFALTACNSGFQADPYDAADLKMQNAIFATAPTSLWSDDSFSLNKFTATFDAVPTQSLEDAVVGFSQNPPAAYTDLAAIVRFNTGGTIDARNGGAYTAAATVSYTAGNSYHFQMDVNVGTHTYSVSVTPAGGSTVVLAQNISFRTEQAGATSLSNLAKYSEVGDVSVTNILVSLPLPNLPVPGASPTPKPSPTPTATPTPKPSPTPTATPTPTPKPSPTPSPTQTPLSGFPDSSNTGVPAGTVLTVYNGSMTVTTAGAVIDAMDIRGSLTVNADNVVVKRSKITNSGWLQVQLNGKNDTIQDCEVDGTGNNNDGSYGIMGAGTMLRNNVHGVENGITPGGGSSLIQDNYVHDLQASGSPHYDGIQMDGGLSNITIRHNTIINPNNQTSAIMIDNYFGAMTNIIVDNNRLVGGGYTIYVDAQFNSNPITGVSITNNRLGIGGFGYFDFNQASPSVSGNVDDMTGKPIN